MEIVNFQERLPEFGTLNHNGRLITTKEPSKIFAKQRKSKGSIILEMECSCSDPDCKNRLLFFYKWIGSIFFFEKYWKRYENKHSTTA
ncbi:MAG: hypothetical protein RI945_281 [Candidatus Parcubacteria bacterium]